MLQEATVSRVQLALNVANLEESVDFYTKLFATGPAKVRPGYANFAVVDPPLKLVLIEDATEAPGSLNHLGVEVESVGEVSSARARLQGAGVATEVEDHVECCYAWQDKVWALGPSGASWEFYTVLADADMPGGRLRADDDSEVTCCAGPLDEAGSRPAACC
jgi:catechol 2,3-dioxygenase-like lactoylglutathione lyase family enzyme